MCVSRGLIGKILSGLKQLNNARDAKYGITLSISSATPDKFGDTDVKFKWNSKDGKATITGAHITLYEGNNEKLSKFIAVGGGFSDEQGKLYETLYKTGDKEGAFIANAAHEIFHATDKTNTQNIARNQKLGESNNLETGPEEVETQVLQQTINNKFVK